MAEKTPTKPPVKRRKTVDKWKNKKWFHILAPASFSHRLIGETPAEESEKMVGRIISVSARDLTGNIKKTQVMLNFRVLDVQGTNANTIFDSMHVQTGALKRLVRRRSSKVESVDDVVTKDGVRARVKSLALTAGRMSQSQQTAVRKIMHDNMVAFALESEYEGLLHSLVLGDGTTATSQAAHKISPLKRVDVIKIRRI
ncbi:MAG: hypothetical protein Q8P05_05115 [Candidatus Diapherotrites archaeon]|nr:hypothetical protein [Candidatus Diapherotrites archaeon]MDZ4256177.1 hypothetical protein [archaeon]